MARNKTIVIRVNDEEMASVDIAAKLSGKSVSEYIRSLIFCKPVDWTAELPPADELRELEKAVFATQPLNAVATQSIPVPDAPATFVQNPTDPRFFAGLEAVKKVAFKAALDDMESTISELVDAEIQAETGSIKKRLTPDDILKKIAKWDDMDPIDALAEFAELTGAARYPKGIAQNRHKLAAWIEERQK